MHPTNSKLQKLSSVKSYTNSPKSIPLALPIKLAGLQYTSTKHPQTTKDSDLILRGIQSATSTNRGYKEIATEGQRDSGRRPTLKQQDNGGDLNTKIRDLFIEKTDTIKKKPSLEKKRQLSGSTKSKETKPERKEKFDGNYFSINKLPLSGSAAVLRFIEGGKESSSKRGSNTDRETENVPLSARLPSEGSARNELMKRKSKKKSEDRKKGSDFVSGTKFEKVYEVFEPKSLKNKPSSFKKNMAIDAIVASSQDKYTTPRANKPKSSIFREFREQANRATGEYFTKVSNAQTPKTISPRDAIQKIEGQIKTSNTPKLTKNRSIGLKTLNLKGINPEISGKGSKNPNSGRSTDNQSNNNMDLNFGKCKTDRPITSIETGRGVVSTYNTTARRSPDERNISIVSDRRRGDEDTEIQNLIDMLEENKEETIVFEASEWIKPEFETSPQKKKEFDAEDYMKNIMAKVKKTFKRTAGKNLQENESGLRKESINLMGSIYGK